MKISYKAILRQMIDCGRLLWDKDLVGGYNGNISILAPDGNIIITGRGTCLGRLTPRDFAVVDSQGRPVDGEASSETRLHVDIYRSLPGVEVVVHTHTTFTNAFFLKRRMFHPETFEGVALLGDVPGIPQAAVNVTDTAPVVSALLSHKMVALRRHGIVAPGKAWFDCVARIQVLEEQIKMAAVSRLFEEGLWTEQFPCSRKTNFRKSASASGNSKATT